MKPLLIKFARLSIVWANDIVKFADDALFYIETGKTYEQTVREAWAKTNAQFSKQQFLEQKKKGSTN